MYRAKKDEKPNQVEAALHKQEKDIPCYQQRNPGKFS
jgi:hypothetical protein